MLQQQLSVCCRAQASVVEAFKPSGTGGGNAALAESSAAELAMVETIAPAKLLQVLDRRSGGDDTAGVEDAARLGGELFEVVGRMALQQDRQIRFHQ